MIELNVFIMQPEEMQIVGRRMKVLLEKVV
jgi:hypothetical protein